MTPLATIQPLAAPRATAPAAWLGDLQREVEAHPGVNHLFLSRLATGPYTRRDYRTFGLQHYALVGFFTRYMELLLVRAPSSAEKLWLAKVLVDEYGEGSDGDDHTTLYRAFLLATGASEEEMDATPLREEVWSFVREHLRICAEEPFLCGLGALGPGHEWSIPKMFASVIPGLERAGVHRGERLYFDLHTEQDVDHGAWMTEVLADLVQTPEEQDQVRRGALLSLEARNRFWTGVEREVVAWRQPASRAETSPGPLRQLRREVDRFLEGRR